MSTATIEELKQEIERLKTSATITISRDEYDRLKAASEGDGEALKATRAENDRLWTQVRGLEAALKQERLDHQAEYDAAVKRIKQLGG